LNRVKDTIDQLLMKRECVLAVKEVRGPQRERRPVLDHGGPNQRAVAVCVEKLDQGLCAPRTPASSVPATRPVRVRPRPHTFGLAGTGSRSLLSASDLPPPENDRVLDQQRVKQCLPLGDIDDFGQEAETCLYLRQQKVCGFAGVGAFIRQHDPCRLLRRSP
jgi:hypothetical protein